MTQDKSTPVVTVYLPLIVLIAIAGIAWARFDQPTDGKIANTVFAIVAAGALSVAGRAALVISRSRVNAVEQGKPNAVQKLMAQGFIAFAVAFVLCAAAWYVSGSYCRTNSKTNYCKYIDSSRHVSLAEIPMGTTLRKAGSFSSLFSISGVSVSSHPMVAVRKGLVRRYVPKKDLDPTFTGRSVLPPLVGGTLYLIAIAASVFGIIQWSRGFSVARAAQPVHIAEDDEPRIAPE